MTSALVAPEFQGRGTGQPGGERAAEYIAERFRALGLTAGGDNTTYFQTLPITERVPLPETALTVGDHRFVIGRDFGIAEPPAPYELRPMSGDVVFAGYGVVSPDLHRDDLAGIDVKDKIVVLLDGSPANVDHGAWDKAADQRLVVRRLTMQGARGFLVVYPNRAGHFLFPAVAAFLGNRTVGFADDTPYPVIPARWSIESLYPGVDLPPSLLISEQVAEALFASRSAFASTKAAAERGAFVSRTLSPHVAFTPKIRKSDLVTRNVIAMLEGSDPTLKSQAVIYTAHYDAYGVDPRGTVFPGAADNALGVGKLIAVAAEFVKQMPRPKRSIIFFASTGEEYGDLGVAYWLRHPTWPLDRVAADINYDGSITEVWGSAGFVINYSFGQSDMGPLVRQTAARHDIEVIPDPVPDEDYFARGDHWAFVQKGIPALYLVGGPLDPAVATRAAQWVATTYHMPTDAVGPDWNWDGPAQMVQMGLEIGRELANQNSMPQWRPASKYNHPRGTDMPGAARQP